MIEFHDFADPEFQLGDVVLQLGTENLILVDTAEQSADILNCLAGLRAPARGSVQVFGRNLSALPRDERLQALTKVGIIPQDGGLLSGLPVWKNILLPRQFQWKDPPAGIAEEFDEALRFCGAACDSGDEWLRLLPDYLSQYQRRIAAFLRLMLSRPSICIYENLTGNLPGHQKKLLLELTRRFHGQQPGRISVYLEFDSSLLTEHWSGALLRGIPRGPSLSNPNTHADAPDLRISIAPF
jgi:ABC-type lipoprotein export system ATPase subunit